MQKIFIHIGALLVALALSLWVVQPLVVAADTEVDIDAAGNILDVRGVPELPANVNGSTKVSSLDEDMMDDIIDKAITFYFPALTGYAKTCATATLSAALKLYKEKKDGDINGLQYYLKSVALSMRSLVAAGGGQSYMQFRSAGDTLVTLNEALAAEGVVDGVIDWDKFITDSALTVTRKFIDPTSGEEKTETRPVTGDDISMTGDVFAEYIESENKNNTPKGKDLWKQSYRTDTYVHRTYSSAYITLWQNPNSNDSLVDLYLYPFSMGKESGEMLYTDFEYHVYYKKNSEDNTYNLHLDTYRYLDEFGWVLQPDYCFDFISNLNEKYYAISCMYISTGNTNFWFNCFSNQDLYLKQYNNPIGKSFNNIHKTFNVYYNSTGDLVDGWFWNGNYESEEAVNHSELDFGFITSHNFIERMYSDIDSSRIPGNYYITTSGDNIYYYTITNPETGESDTINNYITNNYTYITNNDNGSGSGAGGTVSGNITVDGNVDVGGSVELDVNVNVIGGGASGNGTSYGDINTDPLDDYLNSALDESSGVRSFFGDFFSFLPADLLTLLGIGLTVVILGRIFGR